jgi:hypothetical protein
LFLHINEYKVFTLDNPTEAQKVLNLNCEASNSPPMPLTSNLPRGFISPLTPSFRPSLAGLARNLALTGALALGLTAHPSRAAVIFDNLSAPLPNGYVGVSNTQYLAQAFTTTATDFVLTAVHLRLFNQSGTSGGFELQLRDATGSSGKPGALVGTTLYTGQAQNLGSSGTLLSVTGLNRTLAANTTYYLVAAGRSLTDDLTDPTDPIIGSLGWNMTDTTSPGLYTYGSGNSGTTWNTPYSYSGYMKIEAGPAGASVPDAAGSPATLGLILAGLAGLRRRLRP